MFTIEIEDWLISNQKYNLKEPENKEKHSTFIKRNYICLFKNEIALSLELTRINPD